MHSNILVVVLDDSLVCSLRCLEEFVDSARTVVIVYASKDLSLGQLVALYLEKFLSIQVRVESVWRIRIAKNCGSEGIVEKIKRAIKYLASEYRPTICVDTRYYLGKAVWRELQSLGVSLASVIPRNLEQLDCVDHEARVLATKVSKLSNRIIRRVEVRIAKALGFVSLRGSRADCDAELRNAMRRVREIVLESIAAIRVKPCTVFAVDMTKLQMLRILSIAIRFANPHKVLSPEPTQLYFKAS